MTRKTDGKSLSSEKVDPAAKDRPDGPVLRSAAENSRQDKLSEIFLALRKDADMACSESILERLLDNIRKRLEEKKKSPKRTRRMMSAPWVIRFALLALGLVIFLGLVLTAKKEESAPKVPHPDRTGAGQSYAEFIARPTPKIQQYRTQDAFSSSISPLESLFHGEYFCVFNGLDEFRPVPPALVSCCSDQLWNARSFRASDLKDHLAELCSEIQIGERKIRAKKNILLFSAEANARQAAVLVKQLAAWGLTPVSRSGPLPDNFLYRGPGGTKMKLNMTFLLKEQDGSGHLTREEKDLFLRRGDPGRSGR